jgi:hypothetical protein
MSRSDSACRERLPGLASRRRTTSRVPRRQHPCASLCSANDVPHRPKRRLHALWPAGEQARPAMRIQRGHYPPGRALPHRARLHRASAQGRRAPLDPLADCGRQARPARRQAARNAPAARARKRSRKTTASAASLATAELLSADLDCCHDDLSRTRRRRRHASQRSTPVSAVSATPRSSLAHRPLCGPGTGAT